MDDGAGADGSGRVVADGGVECGLDFADLPREVVDPGLADDPVNVAEEGAGLGRDGGLAAAGLELALLSDEARPGLEDGKDGDDVAGVAGDGALVKEGDDVEADGGGGVDALAADLLAVVYRGAGLVEMGEEGVGDDDVVNGFPEPAGVAGTDEGALDRGVGVAVGEQAVGVQVAPRTGGRR